MPGPRGSDGHVQVPGVLRCFVSNQREPGGLLQGDPQAAASSGGRSMASRHGYRSLPACPSAFLPACLPACPPGRYPPTGATAAARGCGAHTDCGFLTFVAQDAPGIEVGALVPGPLALPASNRAAMQQHWQQQQQRSRSSGTAHARAFSPILPILSICCAGCRCSWATAPGWPPPASPARF